MLVSVWLFLWLLVGARRSLCDDDLTPFLFLKMYFLVPSLHLLLTSWLFLHWFSVLSTSWLCLYFFLLPVLLKSCFAAAALFVTSIVNCISSCCGGVRLLSLSFTADSSLVRTLLLWMGVNPWNSSSLLSVPLVLKAKLWLAACFLAFYIFLSSSEILLVLLKLLHMVGHGGRIDLREKYERKCFSCKQKSAYLCGPSSRLSSLCLLRFSTYCRL